MNERCVHQIFEISVLRKGAQALIECVGGLVLTVVSTQAPSQVWSMPSLRRNPICPVTARAGQMVMGV